MRSLTTRPLHPKFGVEIQGVDLRSVTADGLYPEIRDAFETHSALLFRRQDLSDDDHIRFCKLFGPLENRHNADLSEGEAFKVPEVSNITDDGGVLAEREMRLLDLKANQLWHTDSTFLPIPSLANIAIGRVMASSGGETEIATTRAAWKEMPEDLKQRLRRAAVRHNAWHSREQLSSDLAAAHKFHKWPEQTWSAIWTNPVNGEEAVYLASHAFAVQGMDDEAAKALIEEAITFCTQSAYVYSHTWQVGDVLIWDERATLHRGRPWPYDEPRALSSICVSAQEADGLPSIRVAA